MGLTQEAQHSAGNTAIIILAAGSSSRLGQSKQLVTSNKIPLLLKTTQTALASNIKNVLVVLGANYEEHYQLINQLPVHIINHKDWAKGMGSSLKAGLSQVLTIWPETSAAIITVCDQPFLSSAHLSKLLESYTHQPNAIVASHYNNTYGVPALFDRTIFKNLLTLGDIEGARAIIKKHVHEISSVYWPEGSIDIDTPEDLRFL
jgi:molybdenum cofactor cytidylyltransferase